MNIQCEKINQIYLFYMRRMKDCIALNESINTLVLSFRDKYFSYEDKADIECIDWREDELSYNFQI